MAKNKSLNFIIPLVVYPFDVMVSINETDEELKTKFKKYGIEWDDNMQLEGTGKGRYVLMPTNQSLIRLSTYPITPRDYGYLQHEIFHCVTHVLDRIGMKLILLKSDEAYSYLTQYLTEKIYEKINKK